MNRPDGCPSIVTLGFVALLAASYQILIYSPATTLPRFDVVQVGSFYGKGTPAVPAAVLIPLEDAPTLLRVSVSLVVQL